MLMDAKARRGIEDGKVVPKDTPNRVNIDKENV
jgi:hypothetical protein